MRPLNVLVAEDDRDAADLLQQVLENWGHAVQVVPDGARAVEAVGRSVPDVLLLDYEMPLMNGAQVVMALRANAPWRRLPIVIVSAYADPYLGDDVVGHMPKPIDLAALEAVLHVIHDVPAARSLLAAAPHPRR